jgi:subtilisin family serine protease
MKYLLPLFFLFSCVKMPEHPIFNAKAGKEYLVKFTGSEEELKGFGQVKSKVRTKAMERFGDDGFYVVSLSSIEGLKKSGKVKYIEENFTVNTQTWGREYIKAPVAWESGNAGSSDIYVGVIDEGVMYFHDDLCQNMWLNPFDPVDGVDNDGNGYIDDTRGWDFMHNDNSVFDQLDNHGTHVAGTIGGKTTGVSKNVTMISLKFLEGSGNIANAVKAVDYLTDLKIRHNLNIVASNNSWGGDGYSQALADAITRAERAGILFIAAAGNDNVNLDLNPKYPAAYNLPNVITVGATNEQGSKAWFSNYGTSVEVTAPGTNIYSTVLSPTVPNSGYAYYNGTSMATPHVTGAAVLYKSLHPSGSYHEVRSAIIGNGVLNVSGFTGYVEPKATVKECIAPPLDFTKPTPPGNVRVSSSTSSSVTLTWDAPYDNTGVAYLRILAAADNGSFAMGYNFWGYYTSWTISGLSHGWYRFRMVADDKYYNRSDSSNVVWHQIGTTVTPPADTRTITLTGSASGKVHTLRWTATEAAPSYSVRNNNGVIATVTGNTFTTTATKRGSVTYTVTGNYSDKQIVSNSISLKTR